MGKVFDLRRLKVERKVEFDVVYYDRRGKEQTVTFHCHPEPPAVATEDFSRLQAEGRTVEGARLYIQGCLLDEHTSTFEQLYRDKKISQDDIVGLFSYIQEEYSDRPTQPPSGSSNGRTTTGTGSEATSSSRADG